MERVKLGDICEILNGYAFKSSLYTESGLRIIRITNVQNGYIEDSEPKFYDIDKKYEVRNYILKEDDLLISLTGNVGRVGVLQKEMLPAVLNQRVGCIRIKNESIINKRYLFNVLNNRKFEKACINNSKGIAQKNLSTEWLKDYKINLPNINEQEKISNKLDKVQEIIDIRKKQIEELDELIKSQFVELFGDIKINDKNWIKDAMGKYLTILTDFSSNGSYKSLDSTVKMYDEPNYAYMVRTIDLENQDYKNNVKYITEDAYNFLSKSKVYPNDVIMNKIGSAGKVYLMPDLNMPVSLGRNAFLFRYTNDINPVFIYYLLKSDYGVSEIAQYVRGAVTKTITKDDARKIKIVVPPIELQNRFAKFVKLIDKQKNEIQKSLEEIQKLQESLMNKYFGG